MLRNWVISQDSDRIVTAEKCRTGACHIVWEGAARESCGVALTADRLTMLDQAQNSRVPYFGELVLISMVLLLSTL